MGPNMNKHTHAGCRKRLLIPTLCLLLLPATSSVASYAANVCVTAVIKKEQSVCVYHSQPPLLDKRAHCILPFLLKGGKNPHLHRSRSCFFKVTMATVSKVIYYSTWSLSGWYARLLATIAPRPPVISSAHASSSSSISSSSSSPVVMNMIYSCLLSSRCSSCSTVCDRLSTSVITLMRGKLVSKPQVRIQLT